MKDKEAQRIYMRKYYQQNKDRLKKYSSDYKKKKSGKDVIFKVEIKKGPIIISFD
jgi:hypothetical protein